MVYAYLHFSESFCKQLECCIGFFMTVWRSAKLYNTILDQNILVDNQVKIDYYFIRAKNIFQRQHFYLLRTIIMQYTIFHLTFFALMEMFAENNRLEYLDLIIATALLSWITSKMPSVFSKTTLIWKDKDCLSAFLINYI